MGGAACKAKAILNGTAVSDAGTRLCYMINDTPDDALTYEQWIAVIKHLNTAEDAMNRAQRAYLEGLGFNGPWPNSLKS